MRWEGVEESTGIPTQGPTTPVSETARCFRGNKRPRECGEGEASFQMVVRKRPEEDEDDGYWAGTVVKGG